MTTANLLQQSVTIAGEAVQSQIGTLDGYVVRIKAINSSLRTGDEKKILKVALAAERSASLINISVAIAAGGAGPHGFPRLALATYEMSVDRERVGVRVATNGQVVFSDLQWRGWEFSFSDGTLPRPGLFEVNGTTSVPLVPLELRQRSFDNVLLLFEVGDWKIERFQPVDPYLLRHIAGDIYAVIGTWDITEKELKAYQAARDLGI